MEEFVRGAFGQNVPIGTLYNARTDSFLGVSILRDELPPGAIVSRRVNVTEIAHNMDGKYESRFEALGVSHNTAASILSGLTKLTGSSEYLQEAFDAETFLNGAYHHTFTTFTKVLDPKKLNVQEHVDVIPLQTLSSTHVVTGINWGMRQTLTVEKEVLREAGRFVYEYAFRYYMDEIETAARFIDRETEFRPDLRQRALLPKLRLYSDFYMEAANMHNVTEMHATASHRLAEALEMNDDRGLPLSYTVVPIDKLHMLVPGFQPITIAPIPFPIQDFSKFMRLFDEFAHCRNKFHTSLRTLMRGGPPSVATFEGVIPIDKAIENAIGNLDQWKRSVQQRLASILVGIREGTMEPQHLHGLYTVVEAEAESPRQLSTAIHIFAGKRFFIQNATAAGAIYVSGQGFPQDKILTPPNDPGCYAFLFNAISLQETIPWY